MHTIQIMESKHLLQSWLALNSEINTIQMNSPYERERKKRRLYTICTWITILKINSCENSL